MVTAALTSDYTAFQGELGLLTAGLLAFVLVAFLIARIV